MFLCVEYGVATFVTVLVARARRKCVVIFQEHQRPSSRSRPGWETLYRRCLCSLADAVIANTDAAYSELVKTMRLHPDRVFRATLLVPPERSALLQGSPPVPKATHRPVLLFVGRLVPLKNVGSLLDAARRRTATHTFELWIVGEGPERAALEQRHPELIANGTVRFLGPIRNDAIGHVYEAVDVLVMPSLDDYRSVAVLEAVRFGTPVVDSKYDGNVGDVIHDEQTGLVFDPHEPGSLDAVLERALRDPAALRDLGASAERALVHHTPQTAAATLRDILDAVQKR